MKIELSSLPYDTV